MTAFSDNHIYEWCENIINITRKITNLSGPDNIFITLAGDFYVQTGHSNVQVAKWSRNVFDSVRVAYFCERCFSIFVDINDVLYCSMNDQHQVVTKPLNSDSDIINIVAGVGIGGSMSDMLHYPGGIFVSGNLDLYVADTLNHRIQVFQLGQFNGITVAGTSDTILLRFPTSVVLDVDDYLYIVDSANHRIVRSGLDGFRCLVGCDEWASSASNQLKLPKSMAFDSHGSIYVVDSDDDRIQKFVLSRNTCSKYDREPEISRYL